MHETKSLLARIGYVRHLHHSLYDIEK